MVDTNMLSSLKPEYQEAKPGYSLVLPKTMQN